MAGCSHDKQGAKLEVVKTCGIDILVWDLLLAMHHYVLNHIYFKCWKTDILFVMVSSICKS